MEPLRNGTVRRASDRERVVTIVIHVRCLNPVKIATHVTSTTSTSGWIICWRGSPGPSRTPSVHGAKPTAAIFQRVLLRNLQHSALWQGERSWNGVAILARG